MNYRHAYHAGNHADGLKHVVLARAIGHLARKDKPFRVIDAHAGIGLYSLESEQAGKTLEWRDGLGRLFDEAGGRLVLEDETAETLLSPWPLAEELPGLMPVLCDRLRQGEASWTVDWLAGE